MGVRRVFRCVVLGAALVVGLLPTGGVYAATPDGVLDSSFDGDGGVMHILGTYTVVLGSTRQPDGRLVVVGYVSGLSGQQVLVTRLTTSGGLDTTFGGGDGWVATSMQGSDSANAVTLQSDGKIVVVGSTRIAGAYLAFVLRYTAAGVLDTTFSGDGKVTFPIAGEWTAFQAVAVQPDGRIVAVGSVGDATAILIARFTANGGLDTTFNGTGYRLDAASSSTTFAADVAVQPDGKIVYVGQTGSGPGDWSIHVGRLTPGGALDSSFDGDGTADPDAVDGQEWPSAMILAPDGDIIIAGSANGDLLVVRLTSGGDLAPDFGDGGSYRRADGGAFVEATAIALEPNGRLDVASGDGGIEMRLLRLLPGGILDPTFGDGGITGASVGTWYDSPVGVHVGGDGRITVALQSLTDIVEGEQHDVLGAVRFLGDRVAPFGAKVTNLPTVTTTKTRTLTWTASDDNTGVAKFDVRYQSARYSGSTLGSATTWKSATTSPYGSFTATPGRTYCFAVRGRDAAGNVGAYGANSCVAVPVNDRSLTRSGSWTSTSASTYYLGTASRSTSSGATLKLTSARYRRLALVATTCSTCGTAKVYLGTTLLRTVSLKSSTTKRRVVITIDTSAAVKAGTVTIRQASGGKPVIIEGLVVGLY